MLSNELVYLDQKSEVRKRRLFAMPYFSEQDRHAVRNSDKLVRAFYNRPEIESIFFGLSEKKQEAIFRSELSHSPHHNQQFIHAVSLFDFDDMEFPSPDFDAFEFADHLSRLSGSRQPLTEAFNQSILESLGVFQDRVGTRVTVLILRDLVGEEPLVEIFDLFSQNDVSPFDHDLVELCENWDEYRDKPFEWICEIAPNLLRTRQN